MQISSFYENLTVGKDFRRLKFLFFVPERILDENIFINLPGNYSRALVHNFLKIFLKIVYPNWQGKT